MEVLSVGDAEVYRKWRSFLDRVEMLFAATLDMITYTLRPKIFAPFDFYRARLTIRLIQKVCANVRTIMIYLKYI
jgi:hypothetical protein